MSDLLQTIAAYVPPNIVRTVLAETSPAPPSEATAERFPAAVLFADVSGFTPLTEALAQKGSEGPEELTRLLNRYFSWMIAFIEAEGGEVVKFGGDALIAIFPARVEGLGLATRRARQAAETMQSVMDEFAVLESSVGLVTLAMKIGIGAGEILAAQVGGFSNRWEYIIAGDPLRQVAQAECQAQQGQIVLSPEVEAIIAPDTIPPHPLPWFDWASVRNLEAAETALRCYVPRPVAAWLDEGLYGWLATLRPMSVLFVGINGLDYGQANAIEKLHTFVRGVQKIIHHYQGSLPRLTIDDKGTVLLILFGAPPDAHEDDPERALRCALDLQALATAHSLQLAIGVTTGRVFAGPVGSDSRREYTVMGDTVNLASRLMTVAGPGQIYCNYETYRSTRGQMNFDLLPPVRVKGKAGLIRLYRPTSDRHPISQTDQLNQLKISGAPVSSGVLVGRQVEMARLTGSLEEVQAGHSRIMIVEGEAGIGKSRLVKALIRLMPEHDLMPLVGLGRSIEQETPYHAWQDIFNTYFGLEKLDDVSDKAKRQSQVQARVNEVAPELSEYLPLLNDILNLDLPENTLTASLDPASRYENLNSLLLALLRAWVDKKPLALILEDAHWLDPSSWDLVVQLAHAFIADHLPLLLVVVMRSLADSAVRIEPLISTGLAATEYLRLASLSSEETLALAAARLGLTGNELPETVAELVQRRAGGNPFFAEELIYALHDNGFITLKTTRTPEGVEGKTRCLISGDLGRAAQILPTTIQSIILSRIDRLSPEEQLMLKVAAVIGHTFAYTTLCDTLTKHLEIDERSLKTLLDDLIYLDLIQQAAPGPNPTYCFRHTIIREVTYQSLLFDRRRQLHRTVAQWYEDTYGDAYTAGAHSHSPPLDTSPLTSEPEVSPTDPLIAPVSDPLASYYSLLVYHWHQAEDEDRERHYATLVGEQAVAQFANAEALGYLNRALDLTPETDLEGRYKLLLARETAYERRGEREVQAQDLAALATLVEKMEDERRGVVVALRQAHYAEVTSNYPLALSAAQQATVQAKQMQDPANEVRGYIAWGRALRRQGNYAGANDMLRRALVLAQANHDRPNEAESLYNLGVIHSLQGNYPAAQTHCQKALVICRADCDRSIEADSLNMLGLIQYHLGDYEAARDYFEQAIPICYTIGDQRSELKSFHNIGLIYLRLGDYDVARDYFEQTLDIGRKIDDREIIASALSDLGVVYCYLGDYQTAQSYQAHSLDIREEIGNKVGEADSLGKFGFVYHSLGDNRTTRRYCELALAIQQKLGDREGESYSLTYLGHAQAGLGQLEAAAIAYDKALRLRREMNQPRPTVDALAGLAHVALEQGDLDLALTHAEEMLAWIEVNGIAGIDNPFRVYLTAYRVLDAIAQSNPAIIERAQAILDEAHTTLQERAAHLSDKILRRKFLENVRVHRDIVAAWEGKAE